MGRRINFTATLQGLYQYLAAPNKKTFLQTCDDSVVEWLTQALTNLQAGVIKLEAHDRELFKPRHIETIMKITDVRADSRVTTLAEKREGLIRLGKILPPLLSQVVIPYLQEAEAMERRRRTLSIAKRKQRADA